ncbi:MAG: caspase family protein [Candidatus Thiodiazotropha sp. (ex Monitilora ramsayi)]|nr:caspase family protein [Candidatus Thiodiazotropha sp. (ex Monitilora ramsayi)]
MVTAIETRSVTALLFLTAWLCCVATADAANQQLLSDCLSLTTEPGRQACEEYAYLHRHQVQKLLDASERLSRQHRYELAMILFDTGLRYSPDNPRLVRARLLVKSDWEEDRFLGLRRQTSTTRNKTPVTQELDRIKCTSLSGDAALSACRRVLNNPHQPTETTAIRSGYSTVRKEDNRQPALASLDLGNFHALVIGNNRYRDFDRLKSAVRDAKAVSNLLESEYGFQVTRLTNASRYELFQALSDLRKTLKKDDNLLIYYAGHGYLDESTYRGYWLPVDAEKDNYANWLSTADITDMLNGMAATRVLVVADSCYSGTLSRSTDYRGVILDQEQALLLKRLAHKRSRIALTSGGLEPVLDSGSGGHSVFANAFLSVLRENTGVLEGAHLFSELRRKVVLAADQTPEYADIRKAGHEGGDFIFLRRSKTALK